MELVWLKAAFAEDWAYLLLVGTLFSHVVSLERQRYQAPLFLLEMLSERVPLEKTGS